MKNIKLNIMGLLSYILFFLVACTQKKEIPTPPPASPIIDKNWQFETTPVWQDEFNTGSVPDPARWTAEVGGTGWGNNELQYYTPGNNASIVNGKLVITAKKESYAGKNYTSARLISKGNGDWLYGRFEARAKLPKGRGTWPAIWMLPSSQSYGTWPASGEIDIMEHVGYDPEKVHITVHTTDYNHLKGTQKSFSTIVSGATDEFHIYRIDWTPAAIRGYIDNVQYFEFKNENKGFTSWPFDKKFFMILNLAVGGNWGGAQGVDDSVFPAQLEIDYVKVFKMIE